MMTMIDTFVVPYSALLLYYRGLNCAYDDDDRYVRRSLQCATVILPWP